MSESRSSANEKRRAIGDRGGGGGASGSLGNACRTIMKEEGWTILYKEEGNQEALMQFITLDWKSHSKTIDVIVEPVSPGATLKNLEAEIGHCCKSCYQKKVSIFVSRLLRIRH